ncbi:MAG: hypothetical protein JW839_04125 [Candidatus Lokiarchaeota archaeon]|nr:hypothetical protein [Candidatus Lokiarchaeota archaeon]
MSQNQRNQGDIDRPLFPHYHTPEYLMHKFWSRKPHNIVAAYIENYSRPGEVVLDPFGGSGVTLNEALRLGRRAISFDVNPLATFISRNTIARVDLDEFERLARIIYDQVSPFIEKLYSMPCPSCGKPATATHVLWRDGIECRCGNAFELPGNRRLRDAEISCPACKTNNPLNLHRTSRPYQAYSSCAPCGPSSGPAPAGEMESQAALAASDAYQRVLADLPSLDLPLGYPNGASFLQLRHDMRKDPRLRNLFTPRNSIAIHAFWKAIDAIPLGSESQRPLKDMVWFLFSSMLPQASKMVWVIKKRESRQLAKFEVGSWTHHFFWNPTEFFEVNVLNGYRERLAKFMNGLRARERWITGNQHWCKVCLGNPNAWWLVRKTAVSPGLRILDEIEPSVPELLASTADFFNSKGRAALVANKDARSLSGIPDASVDYIFTDPPYGDSIQYAELAAFFLAWQHPRDLQDVLRDAFENEMTINQGQGKDLAAYKGMLRLALGECFRVLKPGRYMTLTFHDTDSRVRGMLYETMQDAGFSYRQTVWQPPPRASEKSLLHEAGSPTGDYMITFLKPEGVNPKGLRKVDDENAVLKEAIDAIFSSRGQPVPFNLLLSLLDMQLVKMGYLPPDMDYPLSHFLRKDPGYALADGGWFFSDAEKAGWKSQRPLNARIGEEITRALPATGELRGPARVEAIVNAVFASLDGILTPDFKLLKHEVSLECGAYDYARGEPGVPTR